jgi:hypothetical protein
MSGCSAVTVAQAPILKASQDVIASLAKQPRRQLQELFIMVNNEHFPPSS